MSCKQLVILRSNPLQEQMKPEILEKIKEAVKIPDFSQGRNSMGTSESFYNAYYMVGKCFTEGDLNNMPEETLKNLILLAEFASEVFY